MEEQSHLPRRLLVISPLILFFDSFLFPLLFFLAVYACHSGFSAAIVATRRRKGHDGVSLGRWGIGRVNMVGEPVAEVDVEDKLSALVQSH